MKSKEEACLSIDMDLIRKNAYLPVKLAELSLEDPDTALKLLQAWGTCTKKIDVLWNEVVTALERKDMGLNTRIEMARIKIDNAKCVHVASLVQQQTAVTHINGVTERMLELDVTPVNIIAEIAGLDREIENSLNR
ncbi:MAG: hypothetical protein JWM44_1979 [Bacilli bacterium]|nr:hypothetical protein [Bacilli bacterium]